MAKTKHRHPGQKEPRSKGRNHHELRDVDLNSASEEELAELPVIGAARARALVADRPFDSWDDVLQVEGFSLGLIDDLMSGGARLGRSRFEREEQLGGAEEPARAGGEDVSLESMEDVIAIGEESELGELLCDMIVLDQDAIEAYTAAAERIEDASICERLDEFRADHERHVRDLSEIVRDMGMTAPEAPEVNREVARVAIIMSKMGGDHGILMGLKSTEDQTNFAYEHAVKHADITDEVRSVLELNLSDEQRHRAWIEDQLGLA